MVTSTACTWSIPSIGITDNCDQLSTGLHIDRDGYGGSCDAWVSGLVPQSGTSKKHPGHTVYSYAARLSHREANQVWALDTTYIPMAKGFVYLTCVIGWVSRKVLAAEVAITLESCHAVEVLKQAFARYPGGRKSSTPIRAAVPGRRFRRGGQSPRLPTQYGWQRGRWRDNVFVERFWKSLKYERVYLHAYR